MTEGEVLKFIHKTYAGVIEKVLDETPGPVTVPVMVGLIHRESAGGLTLQPAGPDGVGDNGHGRGLCQIDDRYYPQFCSNILVWGDPYRNIKFGKNLLEHNFGYFKIHYPDLAFPELMQIAVSAYNAGIGGAKRGLAIGKGSDYFTTGQNYGREVMRLSAAYGVVSAQLVNPYEGFGSNPASI